MPKREVERYIAERTRLVDNLHSITSTVDKLLQVDKVAESIDANLLGRWNDDLERIRRELKFYYNIEEGS